MEFEFWNCIFKELALEIISAGSLKQVFSKRGTRSSPLLFLTYVSNITTTTTATTGGALKPIKFRGPYKKEAREKPELK